MMFILVVFMFMFMFIFYFSNHPYYSMIWLIIVSVLVSYIVYLNCLNNWHMASLVIVISSGMLLIFTYLSNLIPNPMSMLNFSKSSLYIILLLLNLFVMSLFDMNLVFLSSVNFSLSYYLYLMNYKFLTFFVFFILVLVMFISIKVIMKDEGPMRL